MRFDHHNPVELRFGRKRLEEAGDLAARHGDAALVVTGKSAMREHGFTDRLEAALEDAGVRPVPFERVEPNPSTFTVDEGAELAAEEGCDVVIGMGGGSAMDAAKAIAVAAVEGTPFWRFAPTGDSDLDGADALPVICLPSTSGTGSEVDQYSVVTNPNTGEKPGLGCDAMYPDAAVVDPELSSTMPPRLTAVTGVDVLIHDLEAIVSSRANPVSDALALESLRLVWDHLVPAYRDPDPADRRGMAAASTLAGLAISSAGTGLIHALEHPVSGRNPDVAHAEGLAALTEPVIRFNRDAAKQRYDRAARALGASDVLDGVAELYDALDMPTTLPDAGAPDVDPDGVARDALRTMEGTIDDNPAAPNREQMADIVRSAL